MPCLFLNSRKNLLNKKGLRGPLITNLIVTQKNAYFIQCDKEQCKVNKYVVESERDLGKCISEHREYKYRKDKIYLYLKDRYYSSAGWRVNTNHYIGFH